MFKCDATTESNVYNTYTRHRDKPFQRDPLERGCTLSQIPWLPQNTLPFKSLETAQRPSYLHVSYRSSTAPFNAPIHDRGCQQ